jgi:hypothetical protein
MGLFLYKKKGQVGFFTFHEFFPKSFLKKVKMDILKMSKIEKLKKLFGKIRENRVVSIMLSFPKIH